MTNITPIVGSINWRSNKDELGTELSFDIAYNDARYHPINVVDLGDLVILKNGDTEITRAIIVDENKSGRSPIKYTSFDYAFYLNKSNAIYQFNKMAADQAVKKILSDFNIPVGNITSMRTAIDKIYNGTTLSEIIKDILSIVENSTGKKHLMEMRAGKLFIEPQGDLLIEGKFKLAENTGVNDVTHAISSPSKTRSIIDMKNAIQIVSDEKLITRVENTSLIGQYGRLQEVVEVDEEEVKNAKTIAQNKLKELGKVFEESDVVLLGDDRFRAGRHFKINEPITGIDGTYLITDADHTISNGIHTMKLGLEAV